MYKIDREGRAYRRAFMVAGRGGVTGRSHVTLAMAMVFVDLIDMTRTISMYNLIVQQRERETWTDKGSNN